MNETERSEAPADGPWPEADGLFRPESFDERPEADGPRSWPAPGVDGCVWITARTRERAEAFLGALEILLKRGGAGVRRSSARPPGLLVEEGIARAGRSDPFALAVTAQPVADFPSSLVARERFPRFLEVYLREGPSFGPPRTVIPVIYRTVHEGTLLERSMPPSPDEVLGSPEVILEVDPGRLVEGASRLVGLLVRLGWLSSKYFSPPAGSDRSPGSGESPS